MGAVCVLSRTHKKMNRIFAFFAFAFLAIAVSQQHDMIVEDDIVPEAHLIADPVKGDYEAAAFLAAQAEVADMMKKTKNKDKCKEEANEMKKQVEKSVKAQQITLNKMERGQQCETRGMKEVDHAVAKLTEIREHVKILTKKLETIRKTSVNFGNFQYDQLVEGQCGNFFSSRIWIKTKQEVTIATTKLTTAQTTEKTAVETLKKSKTTQKRLVTKCKCNTKKLLLKTVLEMNKNAHDENLKAWTKATHLLCVLEGKKDLKKCPVPALPVVKMVKLEKSVEHACAEVWQSTGSYRVMDPAGRQVKFNLYSLREVKGWKMRDSKWKDKYYELCKAQGLLPVGCGTAWSQYDCGKAQGRNKCISLPNQFSCYAANAARSATNFKGNLLTFATNGNSYNGGNPGYFYTTAGAADPNRLYHPLCGKYGTPNQHPEQ